MGGNLLAVALAAGLFQDSPVVGAIASACFQTNRNYAWYLSYATLQQDVKRL
ncbi:hypothetical protein IQ272_06685 [Chroococcidiopsidales cyanobacterium LEGE 13417]|nr:hypothetical protein [Chroococcidiopsidales cyanobacterium LEGE 13417]